MSNYEQQDLFQTPKESTSSPAPTLVSRFPLQARKGAKKIQDTSGQKYIDSLEMTGFVQCTFLEKMLVDILDSVSTPYQRTWSAVVTDGGVLVSKHRVSARITEGKESGGSQKMWSTPTTQEIEHPNAELTHTGRRKTKDGKSSHSLGLADQARMWPTPIVGDAHLSSKPEVAIKRIKEGKITLSRAVQAKMWPTPTQDSAIERTKKYAQGGTPLTMAVQEEEQKMWPTPGARDSNPPEPQEKWQARAKKKKEQGINLHFTLRQAVMKDQQKMWPTPTANEDAAGRPEGKMQRMLGNHPDVRSQGIGTLNPTWVEWLMGFPIGYTDLKPSETQ